MRAFSSLAVTEVCGTTSVSPWAQRVGLRDGEGGLDLDTQVAVQDRDRGDADILAQHDGPGALVDDDARGAVGLHREALQLGDELGGAGGVVRRDRDADQTGILGVGSGRALSNFLLTASTMRARGGEVGLAQLQPDRALAAPPRERRARRWRCRRRGPRSDG